MTPGIQPVRVDHLLQFVSDDYLIAIGRVITQWSMMESILETAIWQAARLRNDLGRVVCAQLQVQSKLDLLGALLSQTRPRLAERLKPVTKYVRECLQGKRNVVAHGVWVRSSISSGQPSSDHAVVKFSAKGQLISQGSHMPVTELNQLARDIAEITDWLLNFCDKLPKLKQRRGGLGHKTPDTQSRPHCPTLRQHALQPPTRARKVRHQRQKQKIAKR